MPENPELQLLSVITMDRVWKFLNLPDAKTSKEAARSYIYDALEKAASNEPLGGLRRVIHSGMAYKGKKKPRPKPKPKKNKRRRK